ncbi:MAG: hypothetical protein ACLRT5_14575 [Lachnospiraceae bacterium]
MLLRDERHVLDPKTAAKVAGADGGDYRPAETAQLLTITHNMRDAIRMGNRLIMMHEGSSTISRCGGGREEETGRSSQYALKI